MLQSNVNWRSTNGWAGFEPSTLSIWLLLEGWVREKNVVSVVLVAAATLVWFRFWRRKWCDLWGVFSRITPGDARVLSVLSLRVPCLSGYVTAYLYECDCLSVWLPAGMTSYLCVCCPVCLSACLMRAPCYFCYVIVKLWVLGCSQQNNARWRSYRSTISPYSLCTMIACLTIWQPVCVSMTACLYDCTPVQLPASMSVSLPVCMSVCLLVCVYVDYICLPIYLYICLPLWLLTCLSVCLRTCLPVCTFMCLSVCMPDYMTTCMTFYLYDCLYVCSSACM